MSNPTTAWQSDDDLRTFVLTLWNGRMLILVFTLLSTLIGLAYALRATPIFRSEATLQIIEDSKGGAGGLASLAGQFGSLASLAGISMNSGSDRAVAIATLRSRLVIQQLIDDNRLLPILFHRDWDPARQAWIDGDPERQPGLQTGYKLFAEKLLQINEDKKTGLLTVAIEWEDPAAAKEWLEKLVLSTNLRLKSRTIEESERNLRYLQGQAEATQIVEVQKAIYALMEAELKKLMVAKNGEDFAFRMIDPPQVPNKKVRPRRAQIVIASFFVGMFFGSVLVFLRSSMRSKIVA